MGRGVNGAVAAWYAWPVGVPHGAATSGPRISVGAQRGGSIRRLGSAGFGTVVQTHHAKEER